MGLYLCVFDGEAEIAGFEFGSYDDFGAFRELILERYEGGRWGSRFPLLMNHPDSDGEWVFNDLADLSSELDELSARSVEDQQLMAYTDPEGVPCLMALRRLVGTAVAERLPVLFQ